MTRNIFTPHTFGILVESHSTGAPRLNLRLPVQRILQGIGETLIRGIFGIRLCGHALTYIFMSHIVIITVLNLAIDKG